MQDQPSMWASQALCKQNPDLLDLDKVKSPHSSTHKTQQSSITDHDPRLEPRGQKVSHNSSFGCRSTSDLCSTQESTCQSHLRPETQISASNQARKDPKLTSSKNPGLKLGLSKKLNSQKIQSKF